MQDWYSYFLVKCGCTFYSGSWTSHSCLCIRLARGVMESRPPSSALNKCGDLVRKYPAHLPLVAISLCPIPCPRVTQQELPEVHPAYSLCCFLASFPVCLTLHLLQDLLPNKLLQSCLSQRRLLEEPISYNTFEQLL